MISMALFSAFVVMLPNVSFFFGVPARWLLLLLMGFSSLQLLAEHQWISMLQLLTLSLAAIFFMKKSGYREPLYFFSSQGTSNIKKPFFPKPINLPRPKTEGGDCRFTGSTIVASIPPENLQKKKNTESSSQNKETFSMIHIDQLLDKINQTGFDSLTNEEKEKLEAARLALLKRDKEV